MKTCFGTIYPNLQEVPFGQEIAGKVFQVRIDTLGSGHRERKMEANLREWQDCQQCEEFRSCYEFSSAKLQLQTVISAL